MLRSIDYKSLIAVSVILGLAPFYPMPHVAEKLIMLFNGTLKRPLDIFDLFFHTAPLFVILLKYYLEKKKKHS